MSRPQPGKVYLVGAGPGDPDLLTVRAAKLLNAADVVLHDDLVPQPILDLASNHALIVSVGKRCRRKKITQSGIHELLITSARRGMTVIRLQSGDPAIFGRAGEEVDALRAAGVPFEIVPGITAASAAAALLGVSLTDRRLASRLIFLSGHRAGSEPQPSEGALCSAQEPENATLAIYMPGSALTHVTSALLRAGVSASMPCVVVCDASRPEAQYHAFRLADAVELPHVPGPRLFLVGRVLTPLVDAVLSGDTAARDSIALLASSLRAE
jgi:uroporphyrin-III C-methyltransferase